MWECSICHWLGEIWMKLWWSVWSAVSLHPYKILGSSTFVTSTRLIKAKSDASPSLRRQMKLLVRKPSSKYNKSTCSFHSSLGDDFKIERDLYTLVFSSTLNWDNFIELPNYVGYIVGFSTAEKKTLFVDNDQKSSLSSDNGRRLEVREQTEKWRNLFSPYFALKYLMSNYC